MSRMSAKLVLLGLIVGIMGATVPVSAVVDDVNHAQLGFLPSQPYLMPIEDKHTPSANPTDSPTPLKIKVSKFYDAVEEAFNPQVVVMQNHRVLGGEVDMSRSANKRLPAEKFPFTLNFKNKANIRPVLTIGSISGINTPEAHKRGQASANHISSPVVIKVNGIRVQYVYENGQNIKLAIPPHVFRKEGFNTIQVEAGYYFPEDNRIAYDEIHLDNIGLDF